jgi:hypothetical protein
LFLTKYGFVAPAVKFNFGQSVKVQGSNGVVEAGWQVGKSGSRAGEMIVIKGNLEKTVTIEELRALNPQK